ncbi:MAG TPA: hypothetical protein VNQ90_20270 [Chthoniobacteraceae bacterium]|nr:hypothetical protein [Chthoniobacteraceae bacterium]
MAESFEEDRKAALVARLERSRREISRNVDGVRHDLDVRTQLRSSVVRQKGFWLSGAAVAGWLLAGWPRRRKALPAPSRKKEVSARRGGGFLLALFGLIGSIIKPAVTSFLTRKLRELASGEDSRAHRY